MKKEEVNEVQLGAVCFRFTLQGMTYISFFIRITL